MTTIEEWKREGAFITKRTDKAAWALAWWLVVGQVKGWDPDFSLSASITGYSTEHLWNCWRVGLAFPEGKAHPDLSFSAHKELLREPDEIERRLVLSQAIENRWTAQDVAEHFRRKERGREPSVPRAVALQREEPPSRPSTYQHRRAVCPRCGDRFTIRGNKEGEVSTEPAVGILKHPIEVGSLQASFDRAQQALAEHRPGGRLVLAAVDDDGQVGGRVALTFKKVDDDGDTFAVGAFGEYTVNGERRAGGVIAWEWS